MRSSFLIYILLVSFSSLGQVYQGISNDLKNQIEKAHAKKDLVELGKYFIGRPYSHMALSRGNPEEVYYSLKDFDCVTYIENMLALYESNGLDSVYKKRLIELRYVKSNDIRYETRLHYLSSAFEKWQQMGIIDQVHASNERLLKKDIHYLSAYLAGNHFKIDVNQIKTTEQALSEKPMSFIDRKQIAQFLPKLKSGDIVAFVSKRSDLDFKHVGFIMIQHGKAFLLHASQEKKVICISDQDVATYVLNHPQMIGIQVYRPNLYVSTLSF
jgi:hypothetical protein